MRSRSNHTAAWRQMIVDAQHLARVTLHTGAHLQGELLDVTALGVTLAAISEFSSADDLAAIMPTGASAPGWVFLPWASVLLITEGSDTMR